VSRYFLEIAYDGTDFHGWQVQLNAHAVQAEIHKALFPLLPGNKIDTIGCGRTDTGVHAKQFYLHLDIVDSTDISELVYKLNRLLPFSISVYRIIKVHDDAHARFDAVSRTYKYYFHNRKDPFLQNRSAFLFSQVDVDVMNISGELMKKFTDFTSFSKLNTDTKTNDCKVTEAYWQINNHQLIFTITADRFLRNMVRATVGTMLQVGKGKITTEQFCEIIEKKDRGEAGESVPACGLYLQKVIYPFIDHIER
jgi:tRNA pseudouridine38-40 synthase